MIFSDEEMVFGRVISYLKQLIRTSLVQVGASGPVRGVRKHVKIRELVGCLRPERLQSGGGVGPAPGEEIAKAEQVAGLERLRLVTYYSFEGRDRLQKFVLPVVGQAHVQAYARDLGQQVLGLLQHGESLAPLFAAHVNHA